MKNPGLTPQGIPISQTAKLFDLIRIRIRNSLHPRAYATGYLRGIKKGYPITIRNNPLMKLETKHLIPSLKNSFALELKNV